ncbi:S1 family peptidase [Undibacter mobilis]|nr:serine protease [Undibacter mobilis]
MRFGPLFAATALALSAGVALAQSGGPDAAPYPIEDAAPAHRPETAPAKPKVAADKPAKPAETKPTETKTTETKPAPAVVLPPAKPDALKALAASPPASPKDVVKEQATEPAKEPVKQASVQATPKEPDKDGTTLKDALKNEVKEGDTLYGNAADERLLIQAALLWAGDFTGTAENGDDPLAVAIKNFQKRKNYKVTGTLSDRERSELIGAAKTYQDEFGWNVVVDPATGIRIGLPTKMVPLAKEAARGTHWSSRYGDVQVETFRVADPALKLSVLFEREKQEPATRKVEYSILRDDSFFISGLQGLKKFSVRAQIRNGEVRGFTMLYDQAMEGIVAPVMVAMAAAFSPFPARSAPFATLAKSVDYGNGLVVSAQGHIVTDARLTQGCRVLVAGGFGDAERIAEDKDKGLALLRIYGARDVTPLALPRQGAAAKGDVTIAGIPDPKENGGHTRLTEIKAKLAGGNALELRDSVPMAGFSGAAAIDAGGRFIGLTEMRNAVLASIQPAVPPVRLVRADQIRSFLDAHKVAQPSASASNPRDAVVRIICVRK